jgi:hypothetical protein
MPSMMRLTVKEIAYATQMRNSFGERIQVLFPLREFAVEVDTNCGTYERGRGSSDIGCCRRIEEQSGYAASMHGHILLVWLVLLLRNIGVS